MVIFQFQSLGRGLVKDIVNPEHVTLHQPLQCPTYIRNSPPCPLSPLTPLTIHQLYPHHSHFQINILLQHIILFNSQIICIPKHRVIPETSGNTRNFGYYPKFRVIPDISGYPLPEDFQN